MTDILCENCGATCEEGQPVCLFCNTKLPINPQITLSAADGSGAQQFAFSLNYDGEYEEDPGPVEISSALLQVDEDESVQIDRSDGAHIEATRQGNQFRLEFCGWQDENNPVYYVLIPGAVDYDIANSVMQEFARGESTWRTSHDWRETDADLLLELEDGTEVPSPDDGEISNAIRLVGLGGENTYLILNRGDGRFMQACVNGSGYCIEYSEGRPGEHYALSDSEASSDVCNELFRAFASGETGWKETYSWSPVKY